MAQKQAKKQEQEKFLSGFKVFLMLLIPIAILAILIMVIPYGIAHGTLYVTFPIFIGILSFLTLLRLKRFFISVKDMKYFDQIATIIILLAFFPVVSVMVMIALLVILINKKSLYVVTWVLSVVLVFMFGIQIIIKGKLPEGRFILVYNHTSNLDDVIDPIIMGRRPWKVIYEKTAPRIPFVREFVNYIGIPIVRKGPNSDKKEACEEVELYLSCKEDGNLLVFPEGGRLSVTEYKEEGTVVKKFQKRTFQWAQENNIPIVPVAVDGCMNILPKNSKTKNERKTKEKQWWLASGTINIHILEHVNVDKDADATVVANEIRKSIIDELLVIRRDKKRKGNLKAP